MKANTEHFRPRRDFAGLEQRRFTAARLFREGRPQAEVARTLGVSRQSVSRWYAQYRHGGVQRLKGAGRAGRKPRLDEKQLKRVDSALRQGPRAFGVETDLWTLPRIAMVIERVTGVRYHPGHVWRVLGQLGWTLQRPAKRARERDEEAIQNWISQRWPAVKKTPGVGEAG
jgi:transposase